MLHISIKPEVIFEIAGFPVTNSIFASWVLIVLFFFIGLYFRMNAHSKTSRGVFFIRFILSKMYNFFKPISGKVGEEVFPIIASMFLFILLGNWMGLLPGYGSIIIAAEQVVVETSHHVVDDHMDTEHLAKDSHGEVMQDEVVHEEVTADSHAGEEHHATFIPVLRGATADLNMTFALALISFAMIQFYGIRELKLGFLKKLVKKDQLPLG